MNNLVGETVTRWYLDNGTWKPSVTGTVRAVADNGGGLLLEVAGDVTGLVEKGTLVLFFVLQSPTERLMVGWPA